MDMDYSMAIATLKQSDLALAQVIDQIGACTLAETQQSGDVLASVTRSIIYQQLSGKAAAAIHQRFLQLYADTNLEQNIEQNTQQSFPTAEAILNTPDDILRSVGISYSKIVYLKDLAQKVIDGLPTLAELEQMEDEAIIQTLTQVKGVGRWTAQMLLIFRLHRWDVLPVDDLGIRNGIRRVYNLPEPPTKRQVEQFGQRWQPYRTIASWYLWRSQ